MSGVPHRRISTTLHTVGHAVAKQPAHCDEVTIDRDEGGPIARALPASHAALARDLVDRVPSTAGASAIPREVHADLAAMTDDPAEIRPLPCGIIDRRGGTGAGSPGIGSDLTR